MTFLVPVIKCLARSNLKETGLMLTVSFTGTGHCVKESMVAEKWDSWSQCLCNQEAESRQTGSGAGLFSLKICSRWHLPQQGSTSSSLISSHSSSKSCRAEVQTPWACDDIHSSLLSLPLQHYSLLLSMCVDLIAFHRGKPFPSVLASA